MKGDLHERKPSLKRGSTSLLLTQHVFTFLVCILVITKLTKANKINAVKCSKDENSGIVGVGEAFVFGILLGVDVEVEVGLEVGIDEAIGVGVGVGVGVALKLPITKH